MFSKIAGYFRKDGNYQNNRTKTAIHSLDGFSRGDAEEKLIDGIRERKMLESGLVEIVSGNQHASNGLLMTADGYFITAKHCLRDWRRKSIRLADGNTYRIEKFCAAAKNVDIAMAKAEIPHEAGPMTYLFFHEDDFPERSEIVMHSRINGAVRRKYGLTCKSERTILFNSSILAREGDSGSVVTTADFKIMGILTSSSNEVGRRGMGVKLSPALDLVDLYRKKMIADFRKHTPPLAVFGMY